MSYIFKTSIFDYTKNDFISSQNINQDMSTIPNITELGIPLVRHKTLKGADLHFAKVDDYFGSPQGNLVPDTINYLVRDKTTGLIYISIGTSKNDWQVIYGKIRTLKNYFTVGPGGSDNFTLSKTPEIDSVDVFINGQLQHETKPGNPRAYTVDYDNDKIVFNGIVPEGSLVYVKFATEKP